MEFNYSVEKEGGSLIIKLAGEYNETASMTLPEFMLQACQKEKVNKILIDGLEGDWTGFATMQRFSFGEKLADVVSTRIKIAVAIPQKAIDKFAEKVARNRGVDIAVFGELEDAIAWLKKPIHSIS